ncbi:MAG TPA: symmetrical bis(5'-nucleosyl)-tetraphosphatase [bacterium]|nr:symmetrical bis(5'-nucleosyl)-tetraphosphatase [bacterium]
MSTYAIGDIQGCFLTLQKLLEKIGFDPAADRLWLLGDLVNRGPRSLEVLRWASGHGDRVQAVLGNHDLHLLARAAGIDKAKSRDTLDPILKAPDRDDLLAWLKGRPLFHREGANAMVHGGLAPDWDMARAEALAREAEAAIRGGGFAAALKTMNDPRPRRWKESLAGPEREAAILHIFTRIRMVRENGQLDFEFKGAPDQAPAGSWPWFEAEERNRDPARLFFGHWAALGLRIGQTWVGLDSGCVWGRSLSAMRLEDGIIFQESFCD